MKFNNVEIADDVVLAELKRCGYKIEEPKRKKIFVVYGDLTICKFLDCQKSTSHNITSFYTREDAEAEVAFRKQMIEAHSKNLSDMVWYWSPRYQCARLISDNWNCDFRHEHTLGLTGKTKEEVEARHRVYVRWKAIDRS